MIGFDYPVHEVAGVLGCVELLIFVSEVGRLLLAFIFKCHLEHQLLIASIEVCMVRFFSWMVWAVVKNSVSSTY